MRSDLGTKLAALALLCFVLPSPSAAQEEASLEETLNQLSGDAAAQYLAPVSSSFGANLNSGWFHRAPKAVKLGFNFEAGFVAMGSFFPDDATHFDVEGSFRFSDDEAAMILDYWADQPDSPDFESIPGLEDYLIDQITADAYRVGISGATVIGAATDSVTVAYGGDTLSYLSEEYVVPATDVKLPFGGFGDLADINLMPLMAPQLTLGTVYGTQFTLRYLPAVEIDQDLGEFKYLGFGIQHNPMVWLDMKLPVDVSASFFTQNMKVGDLFECSSTAFGVNASKTLGWRFLNLTPYAGFMLENASMKVSYDFIVDTPAGPVTQPISLDLESENTSRLTLGLNARLGIVNWNIDYSLAAYPAISTGVNLAF
ncbi:MAG: DUF6588 family protein [Candidatus Delongbacteria bacterium]